MKTLTTVCVGSALIASALARADDSAAAGRRILERNQDAVVTVKIAANYRISFGGRDQKTESKSDAVGTVIDASGLTVISLSAIDPSNTLNQLIASRMRRSGQNLDFKVESEVTDVKIVLKDGTEIPATVVLRDKDLDLAYIRPIDKPAKPLAAVDITSSAKAAVLDEVVCLNRLGKVASRSIAVSLERINALVERPRPFYVLSPGQGSSGVGAPVFTLDGKLLGIVLIRAVPPDGDSNMGGMFSGTESLGITPIIVPTADIRDGAKQAMEAKASEPAPSADEKTN
jgi:hypothetical protein